MIFADLIKSFHLLSQALELIISFNPHITLWSRCFFFLICILQIKKLRLKKVKKSKVPQVEIELFNSKGLAFGMLTG